MTYFVGWGPLSNLIKDVDFGTKYRWNNSYSIVPFLIPKSDLLHGLDSFTSYNDFGNNFFLRMIFQLRCRWVEIDLTYWNERSYTLDVWPHDAHFLILVIWSGHGTIIVTFSIYFYCKIHKLQGHETIIVQTEHNTYTTCVFLTFVFIHI